MRGRAGVSRFHGTDQPTAVETDDPLGCLSATLQHCVAYRASATKSEEGTLWISFVQHNAQSTWTANDVQEETFFSCRVLSESSVAHQAAWAAWVEDSH